MRRWYRLNGNGVTLLELMLMLVTVSIVVAAIPLMFRSGTNIWDKGDSHAEAMQNGLIGVDDVTRNLRQAYSVTSVSDPSDTQGYIQYKEDEDSENDGRYEYYQAAGSEYLRRGVPDALNPLTEPVESLTFIGYERDGTTPTTNPDDIASVRVELVTPDEQDNINPIPLTSRVYLRARDYPPPAEVEEFALFGGRGVNINNRAYVGLNFPPSNVGTNSGIDINNNVGVYGAIHYLDDLNYHPNNPPETTGPYVNTYTLLPCPTDFSIPESAPDITLTSSDPDILYLPDDNPGDPSGDDHNFYYGHLDFASGKDLYLTGGYVPEGEEPFDYYANYYFKSFTAGNSLKLHFLLTGSGGVNVFVDGKVIIGNTMGSLTEIEGADEVLAASLIYFETHHWQTNYDGPNPEADGAWHMGNNMYWLGTMYAPYGSIYLVNGILKGSVYSACGEANLTGGAYAPSPTGWTEVDYVGSIYLQSRGYDCWWDCLVPPPSP